MCAGAPLLAVLQHYNRGLWTRQRTQDVHVLWTRPRTQDVPVPSCSSSAVLKGKTLNESTSWSPSSLPANTDKNILLFLVFTDVFGDLTKEDFLCLTYCSYTEIKIDEGCSEFGAASAGGPEGCSCSCWATVSLASIPFISCFRCILDV